MSTVTSTRRGGRKRARLLSGPGGSVVRVASSVIITFFGLLLVTFLIGRILPIDPVIAAVGDHASEAVYARVREEMGLNLPLWQQFFVYVSNVLHGDFGKSILTSQPVLTDIARVFPATLELATLGTIIGVILGVPLGVFAAVHKGKWPDHLVRIFGLVGYSMPIFWLGLMGLLVFYMKLDWVAGPGRVDAFYADFIEPTTGLMLVDTLLDGDIDLFWNAVSHIILPASLLAYFSLAYIARMTRSFMLEQLSQEYILAARVKGISEFRIIWRHALGNVMVPLVTVIALSYANLLEGSVLTETIFAWPGLGLYITNSLLNADMNAVLGGTVVVGAVFIGVNMLSDLLYRLLDPRARR
ncbi:ABC transporter permease [Thalassospira marina]|uniref:Peptide ABC transporter permease n=1 Tax=Thalassospira marina TaxID=2048283 RepID=A0A2N3KRX7_9PROT|nr:ABC transporter permease [Thalassospira marina]AUG52564.1 peptide ABC transporter permease [Thalassospira marina]PKR53318.1 peptide ABC transporter permease [Thalassospira marina]